MTPSGKIDSAGPVPLRRLTINEYNNTLRDLLGADVPTIKVEGGFSGDQEVSSAGFLGGAVVGGADDARKFSKLSDEIAAAVMPRLGQLMPQGCGSPTGAAEQDCAKKFIEEFGLRAFRRPLSDDEKGDLFALYTKVRGADIGLNHAEGVRTLISAMLQSPMFSYRWELGGAPTRAGELVKLNDYEMASRLSYLVLASMPDDDLFAAAAAGKLSEPAQIAAQAKRLLATEKARIGLGEFVVQWLQVYSVPTLSKDETFTNYNPAVGAMMLKETGAFFAAIMQGTGKFDDLFTSSSSFVDGSLAKLYGASNVTGTELRQAALNPAQRAGVLTHGSFLAGHSDTATGNPIHRGLLLLEKVLCQTDHPAGRLRAAAGEGPRPEHLEPEAVRGVHADRRPSATAATSSSTAPASPSRTTTPSVAGATWTPACRWTPRASSPSPPARSASATPSSSARRSPPRTRRATASPSSSSSTASADRSTQKEEGSVEAITNAFKGAQYDLKELLVATTKTTAFTHRQPLAGEGQP